MSSQFGPYWLLRRIGHGDLAEVFVAVRGGEDDSQVSRLPAPDTGGRQRPGKLIAVKRIWREMATYDEVHRLLVEEGQLTAQFQHPNVIDVFDVGTVGGRPYLAMEYVPGADLAHLIERAQPGKLAPGCAIKIALDTCAALAYVHDAATGSGDTLRVVHGDVTPTNVLVSTSGVAKLIDFSVAVPEASPGAGAGQGGDGRDGEGGGATVRGTYAYMSPEQARGEPIDRRTDVFALGVVLWELLSGRRLFRRAANYLTLAAVVEDEVPTLSDLGVDLGAATAALDLILGRALAKRREDRHGSVTELAGELVPVAERAGWDLRAWTLKSEVRRLLSEQSAQRAGGRSATASDAHE